MIDLIGSEKQTSWAQTIRDKKLEIVKVQFGRNFPDKLDVAIAQLSNISSAKFWIENRDCGGLLLGIYGFSLSGEKLGLNGAFLDTWLYQEKIKNSGDADWTIKKECEVEDLCLPIKFKSGGHIKAIEKWWYKLDLDKKTLEILSSEPQDCENVAMIIGSFRNFVSDANKISGWSSQPIRMVLLKVGISQEIRMRFSVDFVMEA